MQLANRHKYLLEHMKDAPADRKNDILFSCMNMDTNDSSAATRAATPATMMVALVSLVPVPESVANNMMIVLICQGERPQSLNVRRNHLI